MKNTIYLLLGIIILATSCQGTEETNYLVRKLQFDSLKFAKAVPGETVDTVNWIGSGGEGYFSLNGIRFINTYDDATKAWGGFAYSRSKDTVKLDDTNVTTSVTGNGAFSTKVYAVANLATDCEIQVEQGTRYFENLYIIPSFYTRKKLLEGDSKFYPIGGGDNSIIDSVQVVLELYRDNTKLGEKRLTIAQSFGTGTENLPQANDTWEMIELGEFGQVSKIVFKKKDYIQKPGAITPDYICVDHVVIREDFTPNN